MPTPLSAGVLLYRRSSGRTEVLLVRPGGPFWRNRNEGAWMIPKGAVEPGETPEQAALREFEEEVGMRLSAPLSHLCRVRQAGGKIVETFAMEGDLDPSTITSIHFEMEWPPRSGEIRSFPEVEEARWMALDEARQLMLPSQLPMIEALEEKLKQA